jgi:hypothetical protein
MDAAELREALRTFTGSTRYHVHSSGICYTEGVEYLASVAKAFWLLDVIASWQREALRDPWLREFQLWEVFVREDRSVDVVCLRDSEDEAFRQKILYTDFPLDYLKLYVEGGVILLPSEH